MGGVVSKLYNGEKKKKIRKKKFPVSLFFFCQSLSDKKTITLGEVI